MSVRTCDLCGSRLSASSAAVDGILLCRSCAERYTALCRECGSRIWKTGNFGDSDTILCRDCYDGLYTRCHRCGTLLRRATACYGVSDHLREHPYCDPCFARLPPAGFGQTIVLDLLITIGSPESIACELSQIALYRLLLPSLKSVRLLPAWKTPSQSSMARV